jgi:hypothetical protein
MWTWLLALPVLLILTGAAQAQCVSGTNVFNASQELRQVSRYPNMTPNQPDVDSAPRLMAAIAYVLKTPNCTELVVDKGAYYFETAVSSGIQPVKMAYAVIPAATGLTVDLKGSTLIFKESYYSAFYINECNGCVLKNFSIDYKHLPFTQLDVTKVTWEEIIAVPQPGWPNPYQLYTHQSEVAGAPVLLQGFDTRNGQVQYEYTAWPIATPTKAHPHRIALDSASKPQRIIKPGDVFILAARGGGPAIYQQSSSGISFGNIVIYTSGGPAIESDNSQGMSFDAVNIFPNTNRLVSTVAGGIELNDMTGPGNVVQNCVVVGTQDDSIAGNVTVPLVTATASSVSEITITSSTLLPPNPVFFVNGTTGQTIGGPPTGRKYALTQVSGSTYSVSPPLNAKQVSEFGTSVVYPWDLFVGDKKVIVQGNYVMNSYFARGIAFAGVSGIEISGNHVIGTQQAGILLDVNLVAKKGTTASNGPVNNALIANNHVYSTNMGMSGVGQEMLGAIQIMGYATDGNVLNKQVTQQVLLTGNTVSNTQRAGIWIGNAYSVAMGNNDVANFGLAGSDLGNSPHLNDGLLPYVHTAFTKAMLAWCVANPPGTVFDNIMFYMCHPDDSQTK